MIAKSTINLATRKIITLPRLSPSHTSARLIKRLVPTASHVIEYQPIMHLQCSSDLIADPSDRITPNHQPIMLIECMEEGVLHWNEELEGIDKSQWIKVGTKLGEIIEDDDEIGDDEEWKWQAYLDDKEAD